MKKLVLSFPQELAQRIRMAVYDEDKDEALAILKESIYQQVCQFLDSG